MIDSGTLVLMLVLFNLISMLFCFRDFKGIKDNKKPFPLYQIYILSLVLFAALGVLLCVLATNYRANDKKFILFNILILAAQVVALIFLVPVIVTN